MGPKKLPYPVDEPPAPVQPERQILADPTKFTKWIDDISLAQRRREALGDKIDKEMILKNYEIHSDLYKHYLEITIKLNVFYYAITGAIVSFCFANRADKPFVGGALFFPILMSLIYAAIYVYGSNRLKYIDEEFDNFVELFGVMAPDVNVLRYFLYGSAALCGFVAVVLAYSFFKFFYPLM